jgi:hypothetical protein
MADLSGLGDLVLTVGGDITPLTSALDSIPAAAQQAASQIQAAFDALPSATDPVAEGLATLGQAGADAGAQVVAGIEPIPPVLNEITPAAHEAESSLGEFIKTGLELAGVVLTLEAMKEAIMGSLEAFGELQRADIALTAITGDAEAAKSALEGIPELADKIGVGIASLEEASVKFARFGVDLEQMPGLFSAIADAALGSGQAFDTVAAAWERVDLSGKVTTRTLMSLGVSVSDLAKALGLDTTASMKEVSAAMSEMGSAADRAAVLMAAGPQSIRGMAEASDTVTKAFQQMKNDVYEATVNIGASLALLGGSGGMGVLKLAVQGIETFIVSMIGFAQQAVDIIVGLVKIAVDGFSGIGKAAMAAAHGDWQGAWQAVTDAGRTMASDFKDIGAHMVDDWNANGKIIDKIWGETTDKVAASAAKIPKAMAAASEEVIAQGIHTQQALLLAEEGLTNSWSDLSTEFDAVTKQMNIDIDLMNDGKTKTAATMSALQGMVNTLADMQSKLQDQGLLNSIQKMAGNLALVSASALESDASIKQFYKDSYGDEAHGTVEILTASADAAKKLSDAVVDAAKNWEPYITGAKGAAAQLVALEAGMRAFGIQSQQAFQAQVAAAQQLLSAMAQLHAPLMEQLDIQDKILQLEIKHATAIGASGTATLQLTQQLEGVRIKEQAIYDQTMGLSNLYQDMVKAFGAAWDSAAKGIGDAIVSGQNFGQVMTSVFDTLKKSISEFVTQYLMGMLKDALLSNGELMKTFNSIFNGIFASGGSISTGLAQTSKAFTDSSTVMVSSFGNATNAVQSGAQSMSSAMAQTATSVTNSAATMLSGLNLIATAIGAIAGIFSAIELAHTNTLLSRIEESTRRMDIITEQNLQPDITQIRNNTSEMLGFGWNFMQPAMQQVMMKMDAIIEVLKEIDQGVWTGGGGGGGSSSGVGQAQTMGAQLGAVMAIPQAAQMLDQAAQSLSDAAGQTTDAAASTQAAADQALQTSVTQLQLTNQATAATVHSAENMSTAALSMTSAADAISESNLKFTPAVQYVLGAAAGAAQVVASASSLISQTAAAVGVRIPVFTPGGSSTFTPFAPALPNVSLPNVSPGTSGYASGGLPFAPPVFPSGPQSQVSINVNGSQFVQNLMNEFVRNLQNQGIRLKRG